jgi:predicted ferric reductase
VDQQEIARLAYKFWEAEDLLTVAGRRLAPRGTRPAEPKGARPWRYGYRLAIRGLVRSTFVSSPAFITKLVERREVAENTMAFQFERPDGWAFKAGQSIDMTLLDPPETDGEGNKRAFSIASSPQESTLMVATRMRDTAFKRVLKNALVGSKVNIEGPFGDLSLHNNSARPAVLFAGGIGITLFRSIVTTPRSRSSLTGFSCFTRTDGPKTRRSWRNCSLLKRRTQTTS